MRHHVGLLSPVHLLVHAPFSTVLGQKDMHGWTPECEDLLAEKASIEGEIAAAKEAADKVR